MIWHLLAVFISGLSAGGVAFLLRKISRNLLPKWIIPIAAGLGMFAYQAYYDYAWFDWKKSQLPEGTVIIEEQRNSNFFRPWSYFSPAVNYFAFIDDDYRTFQQDGQQLIQYIYYEFYHEHTDRLENNFYLLNCAEAEQVKLDTNGSGAPAPQVEPVERNGLLFSTLCP